jgi:Flp pilus assembly pilin Flp
VNLLKQLIEDESGVTMTHYAMLMAIVSIAGVGAMNTFMTSFEGMVERVGSVLGEI